MKRLKVLLAFLIGIAIIFPATTYAENGEDFVFEDCILVTDDYDYETGTTTYKVQDNVLVKYNGDSQTVVIPNGVTAIEDSAFMNNTNIKKLVIPEGVTNIGPMAFRDCSNLVEVVMPNSIRYIEYAAFSGCKNLSSINLPEGLKGIANEAFKYTGLESVIIPSSIKKIHQSSFYGCDLISLQISEGVTEIGVGAFQSCLSLSNVKLPNTITKIGKDAFYDCHNLSSVSVPDSVTEIGSKGFGYISDIKLGTILNTNFTLYCGEGSVAEQYAKAEGIKTQRTASSNNPPTVATPPVVEKTPEKVEFQGFTETKNLVNLVEEDIVFKTLGTGGINKPFLNGKYKVEIWDENTSIDYRIEKGDIHSKGFLIKQNGIMTSASSWNGDSFNISKRSEKSPSYFQYGTIKAGKTNLVLDSERNRYNQDSPELYAYILYEFFPEGEEKDFNDFYKYYNLKIIKYDINNVSKAIPTNSKILVNNAEKSLEAYTINNSNYFKLRDLAQIVNGTDKQFNVNWNNENSSIKLIPRTPYVSVGGELSKGDGLTKDAKLSDSRMFVGFDAIYPTAYNINGNNYVKLRDIAKEFNIGITWNGATNTIGIDTTIDYVD